MVNPRLAEKMLRPPQPLTDMDISALSWRYLKMLDLLSVSPPAAMILCGRHVWPSGWPTAVVVYRASWLFGAK